MLKQSLQKKNLRILVESQTICPDLCLVSHPQHILNNLDSTEYFLIKVKMADLAVLSPDSQLCNPSPAKEVTTLNRIMFDEEYVSLPFTWEIIEIEKSIDETIIKSIDINGEQISTDLVLSGSDAKIIFELWRFNVEKGEFEFIFNYGDEITSIWAQIYFNVIDEQNG